MREGPEETLTVVRLGLTGALRRTGRSTNAVENLDGPVERCTRNVRRWRGGETEREAVYPRRLLPDP